MGRRVANFGITPFKTSRVQFLVVDESGWTAGMLLNWRYPISNKWHEFYWFLKSGIVNLGVHHFEYFFLVREGWQKKNTRDSDSILVCAWNHLMIWIHTGFGWNVLKKDTTWSSVFSEYFKYRCTQCPVDISCQNIQTSVHFGVCL